jgi:hypothetical protein
MKVAIGTSVILATAILGLGGPAGAQTQFPPQSPNMTFFVTSAGPGKGADLGGISGADELCQRVAGVSQHQ